MNLQKKLKKIFYECGLNFNMGFDIEFILDSIQIVALLVAIEREFNIEITPNIFFEKNLNTINKFIKLIKYETSRKERNKSV